MAPSRRRSDKNRTAAGLGLVTSVLLSPQNPQHTTQMGIGKLFGLSSSAGSSYSSQPQESYRPPLNNGSYHPTSSQSYRPPSSQSHRPPSSQSYHPPPSPGSSKLDFPSPSNPQNYHPPSNPGSSRLDFPSPSNPQSYHHGGDDAPPAYYPRYDHDDWAPDSKILPAPEPYVGDFRFPIPAQINPPLDSNKEDPLLALKNFDIVIVLDDSRSMLQSDHIGGRTRWAQVSDGSAPSPYVIVPARDDRHFRLAFRRGTRLIRWCAWEANTTRTG